MTVARWNEIAVPIFKNAKGWRIIDGFMSTIGRPDHTEKDQAGALVHFEKDVPDAHNHQLLSIIMEELCPNALSICTYD